MVIANCDTSKIREHGSQPASAVGSHDLHQPASADVRTFCTASRRPASRAARAAEPGPGRWPAAAPLAFGRQRVGVSPPAARHTTEPRAAMGTDRSRGFDVEHDKAVPPAGSSGTPGWLAPSRQPSSGQSRVGGACPVKVVQTVGCSTLTGQAPPTPRCADEGRRDGKAGMRAGDGGLADRIARPLGRQLLYPERSKSICGLQAGAPLQEGSYPRLSGECGKLRCCRTR